MAKSNTQGEGNIDLIKNSWPCSNEQYHADRTRVSHSALEVFGRSRPEYQARYLLPENAPKAPTPAMTLGSLTHAMILEPEEVAMQYAIKPEFFNSELKPGEQISPQTKEGKEMMGLFEHITRDKTVVTQDYFNKALQLHAAIAGNLVAYRLLEADGPNEHTLLWTHPTGLECKTRIDALRPLETDVGDFITIVDIKTAANPHPEAWQKQAYNLGYHRQVAFYQMAALFGLGIEPMNCRFVFIVVGTGDFPEVGIYELDEEFVDIGWQETGAQIEELNKCLETNNFSGRSSTSIQKLSAPAWALNNRRNASSNNGGLVAR